MEVKNWKQLASEFENLAYVSYEPVQVRVVIVKDLHGNEDCIEVYPKHGTTLHLTEQIVDFCRCKQLNNYIGCAMIDGNPVVYARIF